MGADPFLARRRAYPLASRGWDLQSDDQNGVKVIVPFKVIGGSGLVAAESVNTVFVKLAVPVVLSIVSPAQEITHCHIVKGVAPAFVVMANTAPTRWWVVLKINPSISS